jgi:hypothetical protein
MLPYTIRIPTPNLAELESLATIITPDDSVLRVYWMRSTRNVICKYKHKWYIQSDQNILQGIGTLIQYNKNTDLLYFKDLFIFEKRGHGYAADMQLLRDFRKCEWSDYASDKIVFECTIMELRIPVGNINNALNTLNKIENSIVDRRPPVLLRVRECDSIL